MLMPSSLSLSLIKCPYSPLPLHCPSPTAALRGGGSPEPTNPLVIALQSIIPLNQDSSLRPGTYVTNTALRAASLPRDAYQARPQAQQVHIFIPNDRLA